MPQQFLNGPQITPLPNKCVAKACRRACGVTCVGRPSSWRNPTTNLCAARGPKGLPRIADEQGTVVTNIEGTCGQIIIYCLRDSWQHRHLTNFSTLAGDRSQSGSGASPRFNLSASEIRRPTPYSNINRLKSLFCSSRARVG